MTPPEARGEAIGAEAEETHISPGIEMDFLHKNLYYLHLQGWNYGLIRYLDTVTGKEIHQIDAHHGDR